MQLGIFARTFDGSGALQVLTAARDAGYDCVQYNMACSGLPALPETIDPAVADAVRDASIRTGVAIAAVSATYNMIHPDRARREAGRRGFEAIAASAHRMGTRLLTVCTGSRDANDQWRHHPSNASPAAWRDLRGEIERALEIADRYDLLIGVEPELANVVSSAQRARELIDASGSERLRIVLDPANLVDVATPEQRRAVIEAAVELLQDRILLAHAKDRCADGRFTTAGGGAIDFEQFFDALRRIGFAGAVITHGLAAADARRVAAFLRSKLASEHREFHDEPGVESSGGPLEGRPQVRGIG